MEDNGTWLKKVLESLEPTSEDWKDVFVAEPGEYIVLINPEDKFLEINASFGSFKIPYLSREEEGLFYLGNYDNRDWFIYVDNEVGALLKVVDNFMEDVRVFALSNDYMSQILYELERGIKGIKHLNDKVLAHHWRRPPTVWFEGDLNFDDESS